MGMAGAPVLRAIARVSDSVGECKFTFCVEFVSGRIVNAEVDAGLGELLGHVIKSRTP